MNYFSFVALTSAGIWLLLNDVLALLFSLSCIIHEFDGSYMEHNVPEVGLTNRMCCSPTTLDSLILLKTV